MIPGTSVILHLLFFLKFFISVDGNNDGRLIPCSEAITQSLYNQLSCPDLSPEAFNLAYEGYRAMYRSRLIERDTILTIIDFSKPSTEERLFIIDLKRQKILKRSLVAHGKNSGILYARDFSNRPHSNQSSLGFFVTAGTYRGKHGYSLRIKGIEEGINNNAWNRAIVIHGAYYASEDFIKKYGRLGRSFGCPAVPYPVSEEIIDLIKNASCLFIYAKDKTYRSASSMISSSYYSQTIPE